MSSITATTLGPNPESIFSEELGYADKANPNAEVPAPISPDWGGNITSILRKFSKNAVNPVELSRYNYDDLGRLNTAERISAAPKVPGTSVLGNRGNIDFANINFVVGATGPTPSTETFSYDNDGSILSRVSPTTGAHSYSYQDVAGEPSHRLKDVSGTRSTGASMNAAGGNFRYDIRGRMEEDKGSGKLFTYGYFNDRVITATVPGRTFHMLYDENMNRVAELEVTHGGAQIGSKVTVYEGGLSVFKEYVTRSAGHPLGPIDLVKSSLWGQGGIVGVENQMTGEKKLLVKDHLGSTVKIVDAATGAYTGGEEYAYWSYGVMDKRVVTVNGLKPTGTFTGKEYEEALGLYYFGARMMDPELGVWLSPDPAGQFFNPYSYGGDPVNGFDPNGLWWNPLDPDDWDDAGDGLVSLGVSTVLTLGGAAACVGTVGNVCFVGTYDHSNGEIEFAGGGLGGGTNPYGVHAKYKDGAYSAQGGVAVNWGLSGVYGGAGRVNTRTGDYGFAAAGAHFAPLTAGFLTVGGNYRTNEFMLSGGFVSVPLLSYTPVPFTLHRTREDGWGGSVLLAGQIGPRSGKYGPDSHHNRNPIGNNYENAPRTLDEILDDPTWEKQPPRASMSHGGAGFVVFNGKGANRGKQLVYNEATGYLVDRGSNQGTFDYVPPDENSFGHFEKDMLPWLLFGN